MKAYRTRTHIIVEIAGSFLSSANVSWDDLVNSEDLVQFVSTFTSCAAPASNALLAPIGNQEVWAAGVTYFRSRDARMEESKDSGGGDFYAKVYDAERPELFFKAPPYRVVGPGAPVRIRRDAKWNVPEPELTLVINNRGSIVGYTAGNDMSSRDIEGENPLYLPQAKVYDGSCAIGPCVHFSDEPLAQDTEITISIYRNGAAIFRGATQIRKIKRSLSDLVRYLYRETSFPYGCLLMTGTGIVPPNDLTLHHGDEIEISIDPIGTLRNVVE
ncbi:MAG TPA: fumarylacetoacetate hydrolase family protein [Candidatus Acidoferrales bacterium]|nr:fumarylacetoacetate hydrolase family protein [Candidatus Acidoferrales bacterium]